MSWIKDALAGGGIENDMIQQKSIEVTVALPPDQIDWGIILFTVVVGGCVPLLIWWLNNRGKRRK